MIIGIGGISNAGKSKLAKQIKEALPQYNVCILCQDDYAFPTKDIPIINDHTDWERPESIDFERFHKEVLKNTQTNDIIIVEGIFAFYYNKTNKLFNKRLFLTLKKETFLNRKINDIRWGKEPDWYINHIWDSHFKYCPPSNLKDFKVLNACEEIDINSILDFFELRGKSIYSL